MSRPTPAVPPSAAQQPAGSRAAASLPAVLLPSIVALTALVPQAAVAGPVICTTTLEAPSAYGPPVAVSRCAPTQTVPELTMNRFFSYTPPFEPGVSLTHQITNLFGIALGGVEGNRLMGFGFPDQTIIYDAIALRNTSAFLLEAQSNPQPLRTEDLNSCFSTNLSSSTCGAWSR